MSEGVHGQRLEGVGLCKAFRGRRVVNEVSVQIDPGEVVGLLGPNGAGKTTTFYCMLGLESPDAGEVHLGGLDITDDPIYVRARRGIAYLPQEPSVFRKMTVEQNLRAILETLPLSPRERRDRLEHLLDALGLTALRKSRAHSLSGGERRRTEIARALVTSPSFLLLDEPFAGIDPRAVEDIQEIIGRLADGGIGILITDHAVRETLKITGRAYIINDGRIFREGDPAKLAEDQEVRRIYLGDSFRLD
ncbi:MAG: LPS export ABC transporter ATP-binding protein [Acidobacteriota bacterium]